MSTLEKAITLLEEMPEKTVETIYSFMLSIYTHENINSHKSQSMDGLRLLQSFTWIISSG